MNFTVIYQKNMNYMKNILKKKIYNKHILTLRHDYDDKKIFIKSVVIPIKDKLDKF